MYSGQRSKSLSAFQRRLGVTPCLWGREYGLIRFCRVWLGIWGVQGLFPGDLGWIPVGCLSITYRLCISPLDGSSRSNRLTRIFSSCSVNQPFFLMRPLVCDGDAGMRNQEAIPTKAVKRPSMRKRYFQPLHPARPLIWRIPAARREPTMLQVESTVQNHERRIGSSLDLYQ